MANRVIESSIQGKRFSYLGKRKDGIKEHTIDGYKADLYLPSTKTIVEVKSVISISDHAKFPTVYSERTLKQLTSILELLQKGYKVCFVIVSLHPYIKTLNINTYTEFYNELVKCMDAGLIIKAYTSRLKNDVLTIDKEIGINFKGD